MRPAAEVWADAVLAAEVFAVDPCGTGVVLRAAPGPAREAWLAVLRARLAEGCRLRPVPLHAGDDRLLGGLDLAATLRSGRPVAEHGILADADGGVLVLAMAERVSAGVAARIAQVLDTGEVAVERDGIGRRVKTRVGVLALDEGVAADERPPAALADRAALHVDLEGVSVREALVTADDGLVALARGRLAEVVAGDGCVTALCETAMALGIGSVRAPLQAVRVARVLAALQGRSEVAAGDAAVAARLVLAPRATVLPATEPDNAEAETPPAEPGDGDEESQGDAPLADTVLESARAAIPEGLLEMLRGAGPRRSQAQGRAGVMRQAAARGRPIGARPGDPRAGRLHVLETLRAAAPWQRLRRMAGAPEGRVAIRKDDFRVMRFKERTQTTTIFVVDASGSAALHRLAEAKGAVELLLAECYVRRDQVALVAFRGRGAELVLPPTSSLVRAKRCLAGLPGGGATPLAHGLEAARVLAEAVRQRGRTPSVVVLSDGKPNIGRDGVAGREQAESDARAAARGLRAAGIGALLIDTSPRPVGFARELAGEMGAFCVALPQADAAAMSRAVRAARGR